MKDSGDLQPRLARSEIPENLTCDLCSPAVTLRNVAGYQGHMAACHAIRFEPSDRSALPVAWRTANAAKDAIEDPAELPVWMKMVIIRHEIYGESYRAICEEIGKSSETVTQYNRTPAAKKVKQQIAEMTSIKSLVQAAMESATVQMYADWLMALEWAKGARDYKMMHTMMKDVGLQPILQEAKQQNSVPTTLVLNLGSATLDQIETKTSYVVMDAIVEAADDADGD